MDLVGGDHRVQQAHLLSAVPSAPLHHGDPVAACAHVLFHHLVRLLSGDLESHPLKPVVKAVYGPGGYELVQDGVARVLPSEQNSEHAQKTAVEYKHILPDGFSQPV